MDKECSTNREKGDIHKLLPGKPEAKISPGRIGCM
jgi:hypothetical protein